MVSQAEPASAAPRPKEKSARQRLGTWGENYAEAYLCERGYRLLGKNIRTPHGEIDLLVWKDEAQLSARLVFVEVKTRSNRAFGLPEEAITPKKFSHLLACAQYFLQQHPEYEEDWQIDLIALQRLPGSQGIELSHFENILA